MFSFDFLSWNRILFLQGNVHHSLSNMSALRTIKNDHAMNRDKGQMQNLILMGALYCIGVVFFITRFPESYWPGKFNLIFQSHQIFHVLVVCAALVQVFAITVLQKNRLIEGDTCPAETQSPAASINTTQSSI